jgi:tetratricopeptide (TPR) repeat protein
MRIAVCGVLSMAVAGLALAQDTEWETTMVRAISADNKANYTEAVALFRQAKALADRFAGNDVRRWATYNRLGVAWEEAGVPGESARVFREVISLIKSTEGTDNDKYASALANLGATLIILNQFEEAEGALRDALKIQMHLQPPNRLRIAMAQSRLGEALLSQGKRREAQKLIETALPVLQVSGAEDSEIAITINNLALVRHGQHRYDETIQLLTSSLELIEKEFGAEHPLLLRPLNNIAVVYHQVGKDAEAAAAFRRAQALCDKLLPPTHPSHTALLINYAAFLRHSGEKARAKTMEEEARSLNRDNARAMGLGLTVDVTAFRGK